MGKTRRVVLESFNRVEKLCPDMIQLWVNVWRREQVVLRMLADPPSAFRNLELELAALGAYNVQMMKRGRCEMLIWCDVQ